MLPASEGTASMNGKSNGWHGNALILHRASETSEDKVRSLDVLAGPLKASIACSTRRTTQKAARFPAQVCRPCEGRYGQKSYVILWW